MRLQVWVRVLLGTLKAVLPLLLLPLLTFRPYGLRGVRQPQPQPQWPRPICGGVVLAQTLLVLYGWGPPATTS